MILDALSAHQWEIHSRKSVNISEHFSLEEMAFSETAARRGIGMWRVRHGGGSGAGGAYVRSRNTTNRILNMGGCEGGYDVSSGGGADESRSPEAPYELVSVRFEKE